MSHNNRKEEFNLHWNWNRTIGGMFRIGMLALAFSFVLQNRQMLNTAFLPQLPVGFLLLFVLGILIIRHIYRTLKWYSIWLKVSRRAENVVVHFFLYLVIFSIMLSIPLVLDKNSMNNFKEISLLNLSNISNIVESSPEQKEEAKKAFEYLNQIRRQNNRNPLQWDDKLYELAVFRSKDMYERKYFDHTTPDGKCVKDFKSSFGLSQYTIAENLGAQYIGYTGQEFDTTINVKSEVDGWINSRGHRYNLMYPDHIKGAIGCYYGVCAFLGANMDPNGLGSGSCTTGAEGLAYWQSVGKQPGEI